MNLLSIGTRVEIFPELKKLFQSAHICAVCGSDQTCLIRYKTEDGKEYVSGWTAMASLTPYPTESSTESSKEEKKA